MASLKFRHYATESALIGNSTLQVALNAMDVGDIVFIDDTQKQYIITSKNNNVVKYSTYYGKAAITGVTGTGATRTLTFSDGSEITITIDNVEHAITSESCSGNANSATTLQNTRKINGTNFNGSADITTNNWGTSRNIGIVNSDGSGTAIPVSINGSNNINLKLPSTIKANLEGNASTADTAVSAGSATSDSNGNVIASTYLPLSGGRMTGTIIVGSYTAFGPTEGNFYLGTPNYPLLLRSSGTTTINGNTLIHSGNYNSYSPTLTGVGATGTWGINISGNATTASACTGNAATATKLQTARKIWGQSFDGSSNVSGALTGVTSITASNYVSARYIYDYTTESIDGDGYWIGGAKYGVGLSGLLLYANTSKPIYMYTNSKCRLYIDGSTGNVGIGTTSPTSKLHVVGTGYFTSDVSSASNIIAGSYIKGETVKISSGCTLQYDSTQKCVKFIF